MNIYGLETLLAASKNKLILDKLFGKVKENIEEKITRAVTICTLDTGLYPNILEETEEDHNIENIRLIKHSHRYQLHVPKAYKYLKDLENFEDARKFFIYLDTCNRSMEINNIISLNQSYYEQYIKKDAPQYIPA